MGATPSMDAGQLLLARSKGRALKLCIHFGIGMSTVALVLAGISPTDRIRGICATALVLVAWLTAEYHRERSSWIPDVLADRRRVLVAAGASVLPYLIEAHAQATVFMGLAPLAGIAAIACRRREVVLFGAIWIGAYLLGVTVGRDGIPALISSKHPFDAAQQVAAVVSACALCAYAVLGLRRFVVQIPEIIAAKAPAPQPMVRPTEVLTKREREMLELLGSGLRRPAIAAQLTISRETVRTHFVNIRHKLEVENQEEAVSQYLKDKFRNG